MQASKSRTEFSVWTGEKNGDKIDATGAWSVAVEPEAGTDNPSFIFKQEGEKLTGKYKGAFGEADLTGTVKGDKIEFSFKVSGQIEGVMTYTGAIDGKMMNGKVKLANFGEGTFFGKKQFRCRTRLCRWITTIRCSPKWARKQPKNSIASS